MTPSGQERRWNLAALLVQIPPPIGLVACLGEMARQAPRAWRWLRGAGVGKALVLITLASLAVPFCLLAVGAILRGATRMP